VTNTPHPQILAVAKRKLRHFNGKVFVGYLTPAEVLALCDAGARPRESWAVASATADVRAGRSGCCWGYFTLPKGWAKEIAS
jgi:hypothetical protein